MNIFGLVLVLFGIIVIYNPDLIAILIGIFFIIVGANMFLFSFFLRKGEKGIKFGNYELFVNKNNK